MSYVELEPEQHALIAEADVLEQQCNQFVAKLKNMTGPDGRNVSLAATHLEDAFMRLRRSIARGQQNPGFVAHYKEQK